MNVIFRHNFWRYCSILFIHKYNNTKILKNSKKSFTFYLTIEIIKLNNYGLKDKLINLTRINNSIYIVLIAIFTKLCIRFNLTCNQNR